MRDKMRGAAKRWALQIHRSASPISQLLANLYM
jgi:hypothetical protein